MPRDELSAEGQRAYAAALKLLSARARTRRELEQALDRKGFGAPAREEALGQVTSLGYLDDAALAARRARALISEGKFGPDGARHRLEARGISAPAARAAVAAAQQELGSSPRQTASALLAARGLAGRPLTPKERARAGRLLAGKGFDEGLIQDLLGDASLDSGGQQD